jgi:hypothetical protein
MRRRDFIKAIAGSSVAWPLAVRAQERRTYCLGFLVPPPRTAPAVTAFFDELRQNGFAEGDNLTIIPGGFEVTDDHLAEQAAALINAAPDAIVAGPELPLQALQAPGSSFRPRDRPIRRDPVGRAVTRHRRKSSHRTRSWRDRAFHRGFRALPEWRSRRDSECVCGRATRSDRHACGAVQAPRDLSLSPLPWQQWPDLIWA